jgi:predicted lipoprotein with Yx(FWY)xxD motif
MRRRGATSWAGMLSLTVVALLAAGCSGSAGATGTSAAHGQRVEVLAHSISGVGTVLVTSKGYALYIFQPDNHRAVTCTGTCAGTWPPLMLPSGASLVAGPGVKDSLLGSDSDPGVGDVVTYDGWPLYTYTGDVGPGQATGQSIDLNGGEWYVMLPSGQPEIPQP